ncbi:hypothetical protein FM113_07670 [Leucobacter sp. 7(1)]|uniref:DUF6138 family protein n=1 Tax=Leucobacter sp. 7(1) TaxID=1255613 RepID=UPI00097EFFC1|nr:DUF6138 family protein [Leucobacter sp. 7(1)]SJN09924.1 hypothetical protein FM113_07670 [Leucobacter sp. 7(1)]
MPGIDYLVLDDALRDSDARALFDRAVQEIRDGVAVTQKLSRGSGFAVEGQGILGTAVLEYGIGLIPADEFTCDSAQDLTERTRVLLGWHTISSTLREWVDQRLCAPYFTNQGSEWEPDWQLHAGAETGHVPESFLRFACYVAIGELKFGPSYASVSAHRIFDWVTKLGSALPAQLQKHGTGELPTELAAYRGTGDATGVTAKANDALATVRIAIKNETEQSYAAVLEYLVRLLDTTDFPRSYALEFRGPTKQYLPIPGLPKKGVHQLFACAASYPALWPQIARYASAAMGEYDWYTNLDGEHCAMPGTFAVFALGITAEAAAHPEVVRLVQSYLDEVDGEHQSVQGRFVEAYIDTHGFDATSLGYLLSCAGNIQQLRHRKGYAAQIANAESLGALMSLRESAGNREASGVAALSANLQGESVSDYAWRHALYAIWGEAAEQRDTDGQLGSTIIARAPEELRPLLAAVFA